ncbi:MAG: hypothetical protein O3B01_28915 [Planctomycetota bacterium]|nr:hypothetical protein [Planctomycetota bacterium]
MRRSAVMWGYVGFDLGRDGRIVWVKLIDWMVTDYDVEKFEAYHLPGQVGKMRLGNMR